MDLAECGGRDGPAFQSQGGGIETRAAHQQHVLFRVIPDTSPPGDPRHVFG